ncbi:TIGR02186 family protein [Pseudogemmobacter sonorensis]|uniref:TIGR02186 family protein n=1 Tax=Pseudogemmobacter sonorensis TaxID=2989681 RepID=UPI0036B7F239
MIRVGLCLAALCWPLAASAEGESIVSGLSQTRVAITADFDGSEILVYGAVKRESAIPDSRLDVIVTVEGPEGPVTVRRKDRIAGIWINDAAVGIDSAPTFYAVATTRGLERILSSTDDHRHRITIDRLIRAVGIADPALEHEDFIRGLIRVRTAEGRYRQLERTIELSEDTLFRADIALPANLTEGEYRVRMFLLRERNVIAVQEKTINVRKEGLERAIYNLSQEQPLIYGVLSLVLAALAGYGASAAFRLLRRG